MNKLNSKNLTRLESFSDAVFAFAATLLIVSLEVPESFEILKNHLKGFGSFGLCFLALALIWKTHVSYFNRISKVDNVIIGLNMGFLFVVLYFVYPLKFLINLWFVGTTMQIEEIADLFILYSAGFAILFLILSTMYYRSYVIEEKVNPMSEFKFYARHYIIFVFVAVISILLAKYHLGLQYGLPGFVYIVLGILCTINQRHFYK